MQRNILLGNRLCNTLIYDVCLSKEIHTLYFKNIIFEFTPKFKSRNQTYFFNLRFSFLLALHNNSLAQSLVNYKGTTLENIGIYWITLTAFACLDVGILMLIFISIYPLQFYIFIRNSWSLDCTTVLIQGEMLYKSFYACNNKTSKRTSY